jgi:hypothetical protein
VWDAANSIRHCDIRIALRFPSPTEDRADGTRERGKLASRSEHGR